MATNVINRAKDQLSKQEKEVLDILISVGKRGMNSFDKRWRQRYIQLPARIFGLKRKGYFITTRRLGNGSVDYILLEHLVGVKDPPQPIVDPSRPTTRIEWGDDGVAREVTIQDPEQQTLL